tara:strand:- start:3501 stop:3818 length:318 start_codon:yes stop_codon:yes gene_type:complete
MKELKLLQTYASATDNTWLSHMLDKIELKTKIDVENAIRDRATNLVESKVINQAIKIAAADVDIEKNNTTFTDIDTLIVIADIHRKDLKVWEYLQNLINNNNNEN